MRKRRLAAEARIALIQAGIPGLTSREGVVTGLPFQVLGAYRLEDPFYTARSMARDIGDPGACVVLAPKNATEREQLGVYTPLPLWAAMVAAYVREEDRRVAATHHR